MNTYNRLITNAVNEGFEEYCSTTNEYGTSGIILTNTRMDSPFNGEVLDIFEDGTHVHYSQFKGQALKFRLN